jgi:hypothetical protein
VPVSQKKHRRKNQNDTDGSVASVEMPKKRSRVLLSPLSPSSQNTSIKTVINKKAKTSIDTIVSQPVKKIAPSTDTTCTTETENGLNSDHEGSVKVDKLSEKQPKFTCSRTKANHIAQWISHVNNAYEPSEQGSVTTEVTSTLKGDLDDVVSTKETPCSSGFTSVDEKTKIKGAKEKVSQKDIQKSPEKNFKEKSEKSEPKKMSPAHVNEATQSNTVPQASECVNQTKSNSDQSKASRPPLKKVRPKKRTTSTGNISMTQSSTKSSVQSPTKSNVFTPFGQFAQQQSTTRNEQQSTLGTPMNVDKSNPQKFSTPFLKSPTRTGPMFQGFLSSPIHIGTCNTSANENTVTSPLYGNQFQNQQATGMFVGNTQPNSLDKTDLPVFEISQEMSSEQLNLNENALQPDSGFDEVIEMDVDNFEELTETIKAEVCTNVGT